MRKLPVALVAALLISACGSSGGKSPRGFSHVITAAEIEQSAANRPLRSAYDVIQYLRPNFLKMRGTTSGAAAGATAPVVYLNNVRFGGPEVLHSIYTEQIIEIRYLSPSDATTRFGIGHPGGAILITTK